MDIIAAYREVGTYRGAAEIAGTTPKTVKRVIERHESGDGAVERAPREHNYDCVRELVAERVAKTHGRISAKRLLPVAQAAGYAGSPRNFRRLVAEQKCLWRKENHRGRRPAVWLPGEADFAGEFLAPSEKADSSERRNTATSMVRDPSSVSE
jgi:hypothetical protein